MIRINLLPVEKRKAERTPLPRFILIASTAAAATIIAALVVYLLLQIQAVDREIADKKQKQLELQPKVAEFEREQARQERLVAKKRELDSVLTREPENGHWRGVNAVWEVIDQHKKVWVEDIRILDERTVQGEIKKYEPDSKLAPPYGFTMRCNVAGSDLTELTKFRNALKNHPVLIEVLPIINFSVDWKVNPEEKEYEEKFSIAFAISMVGKPMMPTPQPPRGPGGPVPRPGTPPAGGVR